MLLELENILLALSSTEEIDSGNLTVAGKNILHAFCTGTKVSRASMWKVFDEGMYCETLVENGEKVNSNNLILLRSDYPSYFKAVDTERVIIANNVNHHKSTQEFSETYLKPLNIQSMLDVPIRHKGKMVGLIRVESQEDEPKKWTPDEVVFACTLAELYGRALSSAEKVAYEQKLEHINANLENIIEQRTKVLEEMISNLKRTQAQLVESEKMAALGVLVAGIAHEINTPVGVSLTAASHFSLKLDTYKNKYHNGKLTSDDFESLISLADRSSSLVINNLERASNLISSFKKIAVDQSHDEPRRIAVREYIDEIVASLSPELKRIDPIIEIDCNPTLVIETFPGAISQIFTNLILNSKLHGFDESIGRKETIGIIVKQVNKDIHITYTDNGKGISKSNCSKIFEPFYTTKRESGGSGLGMHVVYNLITQKLGGKVRINSEEGHGVEFLISFPMDNNLSANIQPASNAK